MPTLLVFKAECFIPIGHSVTLKTSLICILLSDSRHIRAAKHKKMARLCGIC